MAVAVSFSLILIGGGLVQPVRGGILRRRFWIPAHTGFEVVTLFTLYALWQQPQVRSWLLIGFGSHILMRLWSAVDFIPKALAFERAESVDEQAARAWSRRSKLRFPLDLVTCGSFLAALFAACRGV